jgi:hypothetical protein
MFTQLKKQHEKNYFYHIAAIGVGRFPAAGKVVLRIYAIK